MWNVLLLFLSTILLWQTLFIHIGETIVCIGSREFSLCAIHKSDVKINNRIIDRKYALVQIVLFISVFFFWYVFFLFVALMHFIMFSETRTKRVTKVNSQHLASRKISCCIVSNKLHSIERNHRIKWIDLRETCIQINDKYDRAACELQHVEAELNEVSRHWAIVLEKSKHLSTHKALKLMAVEGKT